MDFTNDPLIDNPLLEGAAAPLYGPPATGLLKHGRLALKGATLGLVNRGEEAETIPQMATEFAGEMLPITAASAVASPAAGAALRALRLPAGTIASRLAGAGATGAVVGASRAAIEGDNPLLGAVKEAGAFLAGEGLFLGGGRVLGKLRGVKKPSPAEKPVVAAQPVETAKPTVEDTTQQMLKATQGELFPPEELAGAMEYGTGQHALFPGARFRRTLSLDDLTKAPETPTKATDVGNYWLDPDNPLVVRGEMRRQTGWTPDERFYQFRIETDPETGLTIYKPITQDAANAVNILKDKRQMDLPLGPEQLDFFGRQAAGGKLVKYDLVAKREEWATSKIMALPEEQAAKAVAEAADVKAMGLVSVDKSEDAKLIEMLTREQKFSLDEVRVAITEADEALGVLRTTYKEMAEAPKGMRRQLIISALRRRCKP